MGLSAKDDSETLELILSEMVCDESWDMEVAMERGYMKAGLKRYHISANMLTTHEECEGVKEEVTSTTTKADQKALQHSAASSSSVQIKIENPSLVEMQDEVKVLRSASPRLVTMTSQFKSIRATLLAKPGNSTWLSF